jgi:hypothetical protein
MNAEKRLAVLEYNHKAGWITTEKFEQLKAEILKEEGKK